MYCFLLVYVEWFVRFKVVVNRDSYVVVCWKEEGFEVTTLGSLLALSFTRFVILQQYVNFSVYFMSKMQRTKILPNGL